MCVDGLNMAVPTVLPPLNMDRSIVVYVGEEEETAGSCADMESPQLCGNSREWL